MKLQHFGIILFIIFSFNINFILADNDGTNRYVPVDITSEGIPGFDYPTSDIKIQNWVASANSDSLYKHAWNLWLAINQKSNQVYEGDTLLIWETWFTMDEIVEITKSPITQFSRNERFRAELNIPAQILKFDHLTMETSDDTVFENVKYSPASADYVISNKILLRSTLDSLLALGEGLSFPSAAMNIKPVWKVINKSNLNASGLFSFKAWTGPPAGDTVPFPQNDWKGCVYVNPEIGSTGATEVDTTCDNPNVSNTYYIDDFIHYKIDSANAAGLNLLYNFKCEVGDYAILVGMHMTTAEIDRWTWETFWWTPNPDAPSFPSLPEIVDARPMGITGAAAHYALAITYQMVVPVQPYYGGSSVGDILYAYNPYLEPPFGPASLDNQNGTFAEVINSQGQSVVNKVGIRTNCMSCHANANWGPGGWQKDRLGYIGDGYIDMGPNSSHWEGVIQADFAWSVVNNAIDDISSVDELSYKSPSWSYYPNPAKNNIYISTKTFRENSTLNIYSLSGKLIYTQVLDELSSNTIDITSFTSGIYLLRLDGETMKLVIQ